MKKIILSAVLSLSLAQAANATLLTFDDHTNAQQNSYGDAGNYNGFNFTTNLDWVDTVGSSWNYGAVSGDFTLLNNNGGVGLISDENDSDFTFDGLWAKAWSVDFKDGGFLAGYKDGVAVWEIDTTLTGDFTYFGAQAGLIDTLHLGFGNFFLVDDIALNESESVSVPTPASTSLFGLCLLGLAALRKKKMV